MAGWIQSDLKYQPCIEREEHFKGALWDLWTVSSYCFVVRAHVRKIYRHIGPAYATVYSTCDIIEQHPSVGSRSCSRHSRKHSELPFLNWTSNQHRAREITPLSHLFLADFGVVGAEVTHYHPLAWNTDDGKRFLGFGYVLLDAGHKSHHRCQSLTPTMKLLLAHLLVLLYAATAAPVGVSLKEPWCPTSIPRRTLSDLHARQQRQGRRRSGYVATVLWPQVEATMEQRGGANTYDTLLTHRG